MISFPTTSFQAVLNERSTKRRPSNNADDSYGRAATAITPRLYLSDLVTARSSRTLERLRITHIVSAIEAHFDAEFGESVSVLRVPIPDEASANITEWFDVVVKFIQDAFDADEKHRVLVHCFQGVSRSATLVCAYLVATTPMRAKDAIAHVKAKRGIIAPNHGFIEQLTSWEVQFEDAKAKSEAERKKKGKSAIVLGNAFSRWMGKTKSPGEAKTQLAWVRIPEGVGTNSESVSSRGGGDHK